MLLCYGGVGNGKTHLCRALVNEFKKRGKHCGYSTWPSVIRNLKRAMFRSEYKDEYDLLFSRYQRAERIVLDDVGMGGTNSNWEWGELEEIINYRYENRLLTVVTTNLDIKPSDNEKIPYIPERIVSRFGDAATSRKVLNSAEDYRPRKVKNENTRV